MQGWASRCTTQRVAADRTDDDTPPGAPRGQTTRRDAEATVSQPRASSSDYLYDPSAAAPQQSTASVDGTKPVKSSRQLCFSILRASQNWFHRSLPFLFLPSTSHQKLCVSVNCLILGRRKICEPLYATQRAYKTNQTEIFWDDSHAYQTRSNTYLGPSRCCGLTCCTRRLRTRKRCTCKPAPSRARRC